MIDPFTGEQLSSEPHESYAEMRARKRAERLAEIAAAEQAERTIDPLPALTSTARISNQHLVCPRCGEHETHVEKIRAGVRGEDTQPTIVDLDIVWGKLEFTPYSDEMYIERSRRRQWLELVIECEHCEGGTLVLAQHKGVTLVDYVLAAAR